MEILIILLLFFGGMLAGLYAANVGGGALVTFPLLVLSGLPAHIAIATNRFNAVLLELSSSLRFYKEKKLNLKVGLLFGLIAACGSFIGSNIIIRMNKRYLNLIVAIVFFLLFIILFNKNKLGIKQHKVTKRRKTLAYIFTFVLGIYGGFFGGGFGTFVTFLLVSVGFTFLGSAAIARVVGLIMSFTATVVFAVNGLINYTYGFAVGLGNALGGWIGAGIGVKKGSNFIRILFIIVILATIVKLVIDFINAI